MIPPSLNTKLIFFQNMNPERGRKLSIDRTNQILLIFQNMNPERGRKLGERADDPVIADVFQNMNPERGRKR